MTFFVFGRDLLMKVPLLNSLKLPRLMCPAGSTRIELHAFGDASEKGYCSVLYAVFGRF